MYWFLGITFLISILSNLSEAKYEKKLPSAVVIGTVYCDTCFKTDFSKTSHFISGALVAVECGDTNAKPSFREEVKTNKRGEFKVYLPFLVSKHVKKIKGCSVKLISSSEPYCAVESTATSYSLRLKSRKQGIHIFSAGFFTFKPLKQPTLCSQKPSLLISKGFNSKKTSDPVSVTTFPPPTPMPYLPPPDKPLFPPLPELPTLPPLTQLSPLPPLPGFPNFPKPSKTSKELESTHPLKTSEVSNGNAGQTKFSGTLFEMPLSASPQPGFGFQLPPNPFQLPPNPFQPPLFFPPNPVQPPPPTPPTSMFPRNPLQPSPPVSLVPPLIGLTPSPPPPPPPPANVPAALPPFPFQPSLGFPGIPPIRKKTSP